MDLDIKKSGTYSIQFKYANGNGPINTENKCAIRTLLLDGQIIGTVVLPQRGTKEWKNWGNTNVIQAQLTKGKHQLSLRFEPQNENMNGEINQALLDSMVIWELE